MDNIVNIREMLQARLSQYTGRLFFTAKTNSGQQDKTYSDLEADILNLGRALFERYGDHIRIGLVGENSYQWIVCYYTALYFGWVVVPLDKDLSETGLKYVIRKSNVDILVVGKEYVGKVASIVEDLDQVRDCIMINSEQNSLQNTYGVSFEELVAGSVDKEVDRQPININDAAVVMFTSGTTGVSKGVMLSHKNLLSNCFAASERFEFPRGTEIALCVLPFHHSYTLMLDVLHMMDIGATLCLNSNLKDLVSDLQEYKPTHIIVVPMIADYLIKKFIKEIKDSSLTDEERMNRTKNYFGGRLKTMICGGAMVTEETVAAYQKTDITLLRGYGITECAPIVAAMSPSRNDYDLMTVGTSAVCNKVKIINGEICVSGDNVMIGYYNDEEATAGAFYDEWFRTGDVGTINEKGDLYITGRIKNIIIHESGKNVYPEEIEELLLVSDDIQECVIFEYKQENKKPLIAAIIRPVDTYLDSLESKETMERFYKLQNDVNKQLPVYKHIMRVFLTAQEFDKTASRKIIRTKICERITKGDRP